MMKKTQVTKDGLVALKDELTLLKTKKRPKIVKRLSEARADGDITDNSDYQNAKDNH